jgi:hypothetical protein
MGPEILASLGGNAIQRSAVNNAEKRRQAILDHYKALSQDYTNQATDVTTGAAGKYAAAPRTAAIGQAENAAETSLTGALTSAQTPSAPTAGRVSGDYLTAQARSTSDQLARSTKLAQLMARVRAPTDLRTSEGLDNMDMATRNTILRGNARTAMSTGDMLAGMTNPDQNRLMLGQMLSSGGVMASMGRGRATAARGSDGSHDKPDVGAADANERTTRAARHEPARHCLRLTDRRDRGRPRAPDARADGSRARALGRGRRESASREKSRELRRQRGAVPLGSNRRAAAAGPALRAVPRLRQLRHERRRAAAGDGQLRRYRRHARRDADHRGAEGHRATHGSVQARRPGARRGSRRHAVIARSDREDAAGSTKARTSPTACRS